MATRAFQQLTVPGAGESVGQPAAPGPGRVAEAQPGSPANGCPPKVRPEVPTLVPDIGSPCTSVAGMHTGAATSEKSWAAAYRAEHALTVTPGRPLPAISPGEVRAHVHTDLYVRAHGFVPNSPTREMTRTPMHGGRAHSGTPKQRNAATRKKE